MTEGGERYGSRRRMTVWVALALLLLLPFFAMQVTDQVKWNLADFAIFGGLLAAARVTYELAARTSRNTAYRFALSIALVAAFTLVWVIGAVGILGTEDNDANLLFVGVLAFGIIGAVISRCQPLGMARAMFATALAQAVVAVIALIAGFGSTGPIWPLDVLISMVFFTVLWLLSGWLFGRAARESAAAGGASAS